jgi:uncharacterized protein (DUF1800 family)
VHVIDANRDGKADFVISHRDGRAALLMTDGKAVTGTNTLLNAGSGYSVSHTGDFNADGITDLVVTHTDGNVALLILDNGNVVRTDFLLEAGTPWRVQLVADFDGDGRSDFVIRKDDDNTTAITLMSETKVAAGANLFDGRGAWKVTHAGDFNGDGAADLLVKHDDGRVAILLMRATVVMKATELLLADSPYRVVDVQDYDGDNRADILLQHKDGSARILHMNGSAVARTTELWPAGTAKSLLAPVVSQTGASMSASEAARFLNHATFGARMEDVTSLAANGYARWLNEQISISPSSLVAEIEKPLPAPLRSATEKFSTNPQFVNSVGLLNLHLNGRDQLRLRVADALSQIFVVSTSNQLLRANPFAIAAYHDMLAKNAFGNFRQLLDDVTFHPAMGVYLTYVGNAKEDPATQRLPDENYAREIMQLFSIGLWQLNADGTQKRDANGQPIPTYGQAEILGLAKVFTGLSWASCPDDKMSCFFTGPHGKSFFTQPMKVFDNFHSKSAKRIVGGVMLPANRALKEDVKDTLDALFAHANVGPFIGRQLIQRLTTSNPSPAYVQRVSEAFNDNGFGVRGDLAAVVRAILLDPEVRARDALSNPRYGKVREPYQRVIHMLRASDAKPAASPAILLCHEQSFLDCYETGVAQSPYAAASVFNFYRPDYQPQGPLAAAKLVAPELQIMEETTIVGAANTVSRRVAGSKADLVSPVLASHVPLPAWNEWLASGAKSAELTDRINLLMMGGAMSSAMRSEMIRQLGSATETEPAKQRARIERAMRLTLVSPEYLFQR